MLVEQQQQQHYVGALLVAEHEQQRLPIGENGNVVLSTQPLTQNFVAPTEPRQRLLNFGSGQVHSS